MALFSRSKSAGFAATFSSTAAAAGRSHSRAVYHCVALFSATLSAGLVAPQPVQANQFVQLEYNIPLASRFRDTVFLELFDDRPLSTTNFLQYVNGRHYDSTLMHRLWKGLILQGGGYYPFFLTEPPPLNVSLDPDAEVDLDGNPFTPNPTVMNESGKTPPHSNLRGTIALARRDGQPNSADTEWFINLANNTALDTADGGFTVFGRVSGDGMSLFDEYNKLSITDLNPDSDDNGQRDAGPFYRNSSDGIPFFGGSLVTLVKAEQIDYLGAGLSTAVPATGLTFGTRNAFIDTGTVFTGTGALTIGNGRTLGIREGTNLSRTLINRGTLAPGLQLGAITVDTYQQFFDGTLDIQLRETTADTEHDKLNVTNTAFLSGKLAVSLLSPFTPSAGDVFTIITATAIVGGFTSADLPLLTPGLVWGVNESATAITLSVALADYNRNGVVDAADYVLWRNTRNTNVSASTGADGNGDGLVNDLDYAIWRSNFGHRAGTVPGASSVVSAGLPEPSTALLAIAGGLFLAAQRRASRTGIDQILA